jgi:hypothetical protein
MHKFIYIDDIELHGIQVYLPPKNTIQLSNQDSTSVSLVWDSIANSEGSFIDISTDSNFTNFIEGYNHKFYTDTNLSFNPPGCDNYYIRIRTAIYSCSGNSSNVFEIIRDPKFLLYRVVVDIAVEVSVKACKFQAQRRMPHIMFGVIVQLWKIQ